MAIRHARLTMPLAGSKGMRQPSTNVIERTAIAFALINPDRMIELLRVIDIHRVLLEHSCRYRLRDNDDTGQGGYARWNECEISVRSRSKNGSPAMEGDRRLTFEGFWRLA